MSEYDKQAQAFLNKFGLKVSVTYLDNNPPAWDEEQSHDRLRYRVTIQRKDTHKSLSFIFWDSIANAERGERPKPYDVLASTSAESHIYDDFEDFCSEFGYSTDSRKAERTWKNIDKFAKRINAFFSEEELETLREIN